MAERKLRKATQGAGYVKAMEKIGLIILAIALSASVAACSGDLKGKIPGTYDNGFDRLDFYSDGTYEESGSYGTGKWTLLDGNTLKLTDFYGETRTHEIKDVTSEGIVLESGSIWERVG